MQAYRIETSINEKGQVLLKHMPFHRGQKIEIIVLPAVDLAEPIHVPNAKTRAVLEAAEQGKDLEKTSLKKLSAQWDQAEE